MNKLIPNYNISATISDNVFLHIHSAADPAAFEYIRPHSHNYYCLSVLFEGQTSHFADLEKIDVTAPALLLLDIDQVHIHNAMHNCRVVSIAFSQEFVNGRSQKLASQIELLFSQPVVRLNFEQLNDLDKYIQLLSWEYDKKKVRQKESIDALLEIIIVQCYTACALAAGNCERNTSTYSVFQHLLRKHFRSEHQVGFYARRMHITTEALNSCLKKCCNKTAKQLIEQRLLAEAKRLLYWSDATVREVAWALGFDSDAYFNRFFKRHTGSTPKEYQNNMRAT